MWGGSTDGTSHPAVGLSDVLLASEGLSRADPAVLECRDVYYQVLDDKKRPRDVLAGVSCIFPQGKLSAVMGASGSGKTSLLSLLRGLQASNSGFRGRVLCNGKAVTPGRMRDVCTFVAQQDVYLPALTPRETLGYIAELRLPVKFTAEQRNARVDAVLDLLQMKSCADSRIGDPNLGQSGCSGGEKKRLSIASAIIGGLPSAMLCDEPTSGLDSRSAEQVVALLRGIADRGVTVVCSIHQPAHELFKEFNQLLLLESGRVAYCGAVASAEATFARSGFPTPVHVNPADHYVKTVQSDEWKRLALSPQASAIRPAALALQASPPIVSSGRVPFSRQVTVLTRRNVHENFKNKKRFFAGVMSRLPASVMLGCFFWQVAAKTAQPYIFPTQGVILCSVQIPLIDSFYGGAGSFQMQRPILKREYYDGLYSIGPYYIAYYLGYLAMQIPWAVAWSVPIYFFTGFPLRVDRFMIFLMAEFITIFFGTAWGSFIGASSPDQDSARARFVPLLIPSIMFSGYVIPYPTMHTIFTPLYYLSPMQWGMSLLNVNLYSGRVFTDCPKDTPFSERNCYATGEEYLSTSTSGFRIRAMLGICLAYAVTAVFCNIKAASKYVINGRA